MNVLQRINAVRKKINYVQKDKSVSTGGGSYRAVTHDQVTALIRPHMVEAGIVCIPTLVKSEAHDKEEGAKQFRYDATYSFDFCNEEDPNDKVTIVIEAHAMDNADKAPGKALSYAKKYAVLKLFEIETGEDEESRYQSDDFDATPFLELIGGAKDLQGLQATYGNAIKAAQAAKDNNAVKAIVAAKDKRKAELSKGAE